MDANTELMRIKGKNILGDCHDDDPVLQCKQMDIQFSSDDIVEVFAMHGSNEEVFVNLKEEHMTQKERDSDKQIILSRAKAGFPSLEPMDLMFEELRDEIFDRIWAKVVRNLNPLFRILTQNILQSNASLFFNEVEARNSIKSSARYDTRRNQYSALTDYTTQGSSERSNDDEKQNRTNLSTKRRAVRNVHKSPNALNNIMTITSFDKRTATTRANSSMLGQPNDKFVVDRSDESRKHRGGFVGKKLSAKNFSIKRATPSKMYNNDVKYQHHVEPNQQAQVGSNGGGWRMPGSQRPVSFDSHRMKSSNKHVLLPDVTSTDTVDRTYNDDNPINSRRVKTAPDQNDQRPNANRKSHRSSITLPRIAF